MNIAAPAGMTKDEARSHIEMLAEVARQVPVRHGPICQGDRIALRRLVDEQVMKVSQCCLMRYDPATGPSRAREKAGHGVNRSSRRPKPSLSSDS